MLRAESVMPSRGSIKADRTVTSIADEYSRTLEVLEEFGFKELKDPILRNTIAPRVTVPRAGLMIQVDEVKSLAALRERAKTLEG